MPNGRSGGFLLEPLELEQLLKQHVDLTEIGRVRESQITASEVKRMLYEWGRDRVVVEEQDGSWYIVRLKEWVVVNETSPFFPALRRAHVEFVRKWNEKHGQGTA